MLRALLAACLPQKTLQGLSNWHPTTNLFDLWRSSGHHKSSEAGFQHAPIRQRVAVPADHELQLDTHQQWSPLRQCAPGWSLTAALHGSLPAGFKGSRCFNTTITAFTEAAAPVKRVYRSAVRAAVAKIAQQAEQQYDDKPLVGVYRRTGAAQVLFECQVGINRRGVMSDRYHYSLYVRTPVQAAVTFDLARCALLGPTFTVNFSPSWYSSSDIETMQQDMQQMKPGIFAAAVRAACNHPPPDHPTLQARKLADAAVAAAAAAVGEAVGGHGQHGCRTRSGGVEARVKERLQPQESRKFTAGSKTKTVLHFRVYDSISKAALAVDMMRQALGRLAVNFPADVTAAGVPAMKAWLELNRHKLTVQKAAWRAKAAAMTSAEAVVSSPGTG